MDFLSDDTEDTAQCITVFHDSAGSGRAVAAEGILQNVVEINLLVLQTAQNTLCLFIFGRQIKYTLRNLTQPFTVELNFIVQCIKTVFTIIVLNLGRFEELTGFSCLLLPVTGFDDVFPAFIHFRTPLFETGNLINRAHQVFLQSGNFRFKLRGCTFLLGDLGFPDLKIG